MGVKDGSELIPVLSIVIVNSDGLDDTLNCLESIFRYPPEVDYEVVLIDNCSKASISDIVREKYPNVRLYAAPQKQGFSKNYNMGIRLAQGELVMILNNDTIVHAQALDFLIGAMRQNPIYGMIGPKILSPNGRTQSFCARELPTPTIYKMRQLFLDLGTPAGRIYERYLQRRLAHRPSGPVPCIGGACMLTSKAMLEQVGLLDESYDFYFTEDEWCHRVQKHGFEVAYIAEAEITHLGDQSISKVREWARKSEYRSALDYFGRYYDLSRAGTWNLWLSTSLSYLFKAIYFSMVKMLSRKENDAETYWRLFGWIMHQYPGKADTNAA